MGIDNTMMYGSTSSSGMKNRHRSPSTKTALTADTISKLEEGSAADSDEYDYGVGIDIWKQSLEGEGPDPFRDFPVSDIHSPQHLDADEHTSLLPGRSRHDRHSPSNDLDKNGRPISWLDYFYSRKRQFSENNGHDTSSMSSSSSASSAGEPKSPSFRIWHSASAEDRLPKPHPYFLGADHSRLTNSPPPRRNRVSFSTTLSMCHTLHFVSMAVYDLTVSYNLWCSRTGLLLNPWFGPSPVTVDTFGVLNPARVLYDAELWRLVTTWTLSANVTQLTLHLLALHTVVASAERRWGDGSRLWGPYAISSLTATVVTLVVRPNRVSVCSSAGVLAVLATIVVESRFLGQREREILPRTRRRWCSPRKPSLAEAIVVVLVLAGGANPMIGLVPQAVGVLCGVVAGAYLHSPLLRDARTPRASDGEDVFFDSPDSPVTRSILLSPDETEPTTTTTAAARRWCTRPSTSTVVRTVCALVFAATLAGCALAIRTGRVTPDKTLLSASAINCETMHRVLNNLNTDYLCEQTCVPFAGVRFARAKRGMALGSCQNNGFMCRASDDYKGSNSDTTTWNAEYQPLVELYTPSGMCENGETSTNGGTRI